LLDPHSECRVEQTLFEDAEREREREREIGRERGRERESIPEYLSRLTVSQIDR
jgi:hypothetical protein